LWQDEFLVKAKGASAVRRKPFRSNCLAAGTSELAQQPCTPSSSRKACAKAHAWGDTC